MLSIPELQDLYVKQESEILRDYFDLLRFQSIATDGAYKSDVLRCAEWVAGYLKQSGLQVEQWETENAPVIFASDLRAGPDKKTLLLYCHYDVQPVDPLDEWITPPFEPTIRDGEVYARGAVDNKGQCFYTMLAIKTILKKRGKLPLNLKIVIEGEEESGSAGFCGLLKEKKGSLAADYLIIVDSGMQKIEEPSITLGARGLICLEVAVQEAGHDMHSGMVGGLAYNPNRALAEMLAKLHDEEGHVTVPGFYDEIIDILPSEKKELSFDFDPAHFTSLFGFKPIETKGVPPSEVTGLLPTLEINGMWGGYCGPGFKTVIPAKAHAKLSCRLVPDQDPDHIGALVQDFLKKITPKGLQTRVTFFPGGGRGFRANPHSPIVDIMKKSYSDVFGKPCKMVLIGGTLPPAVALAECAGAEMVLVGIGLPGDRIHAPNEHFGLDRIKMGYMTICRALELF